MGLEAFDTDSELQDDGVWCDYGDFRVRLARAGGTNEKYNKALMRAGKQLGNQSNNLKAIRAIERDLLADYLIKGWQTKVPVSSQLGAELEMADGIEASPKLASLSKNAAGLVECTRENFRKVLDAFPDLSIALQSFASNHANFQLEDLEEVAGN